MHTQPATHPSPQGRTAFAAGKFPESAARLVGRHLDVYPDRRIAQAPPGGEGGQFDSLADSGAIG
jgi:hypothetical protein